ncbi:MAG: M20/M25/M40 family metallo-hydrolase [Candidatus Latescibacterota bacterium]
MAAADRLTGMLAAALLAALGPSAAPGEPGTLAGFSPARQAAQERLEARFQELPSPAAFRRHMESLTARPHLAGTAANAAVADSIARAMERAGLRVERYEYEVYLPDAGARSEVALVTPIRLLLNGQEYVLEEDPYSAHPELTPAWNSYAASGDVTAPVVYANYGRPEDFAQLRTLGVEVTGRIVVARYGANYRGYKAKYAQAAGAVGLILYSDPADGGYPSGPVYPEGPHRPASAAERGSLLTLPYKGDTLTPGVPALPGPRTRRLDPDSVSLPAIPVTPLPYGSAVEILQRMQGPPVPAGWQGGLPFTYRLTGGERLTVRLRVEQTCRLTRITDVVGTLEGTEFPDEWILLGCHYDAWTFGAEDPNGGTAALLLMAEALGQLAGEGQRPRRTIKVAHWDAEEQGMIGSVEWVEQLRGELDRGAVAYVNADVAVSEPSFGGSASPSLKGPILDAVRTARYADSTIAVFQRWLPEPTEDPAAQLGSLGGGSDHVGFYDHLGIPAAGLGLGGASLYHSGYDDFTYFSRFCDPDFVYGPTVARIDGILALRLANADVLPYSVERYAVDLRAHLLELEKRAEALGWEVKLEALEEAAAELDSAAAAFTAARDRAAQSGQLTAQTARRVNQGLIGLERCLLHPEGLQEQAWCRSLWAAPDPFSGYAAWMLPGLRYEVEARSAEGVERWEPVYRDAVQRLARRLAELAALLP